MCAHHFTQFGILSRRALVALVVAVCCLAVIAGPAAASPSEQPDDTVDVDGEVYAMAVVGDRVVIGGDFVAVGGQPRRNAAAILPTGALDPAFTPEPDGIVRAVAATEDGSRVFLGGEFDVAGGRARDSLAAVDSATGTAIASWSADTDGVVHALAVRGERLYAGGTFRAIGTSSRRRLAALDVDTAAVQLSFNPWPDWTVKQVAVSPDGDKVYATGGFQAIGNAPRTGIAELNSSDGRATGFDPTEGGVGIALALSPDGARVLFSTTSNRLHAYDPAVSHNPVWTVQTSGDTQAIAVAGDEVYFGGHFSRLTSFRVRRRAMASVLLADGAPTAWDPSVQGFLGVWAVAVADDRVHIGGDFTRVGSSRQQGYARFSSVP